MESQAEGGEEDSGGLQTRGEIVDSLLSIKDDLSKSTEGFSGAKTENFAKNL